MSKIRWRIARCGVCSGHGIVSDYRGGDFNGARDCESCFGGTIFVSENDRTACYPGGPLLGYQPGMFESLRPETEFRSGDGQDLYELERIAHRSEEGDVE